MKHVVIVEVVGLKVTRHRDLVILPGNLKLSRVVPRHHFTTRKHLGSSVLSRSKRKLEKVLKLVPIGSEHPAQVGIFQELAIGFVAFPVPTSHLTGLNTTLTSVSGLT